MVAEQRTARSYSGLPQEVKEKISRSMLEVEGLPMRDVKCPVCSYVIARVYADMQGHFHARCRKCKWEKPINLAYFRTQNGIWRLKAKYYGEDYLEKLNNN